MNIKTWFACLLVPVFALLVSASLVVAQEKNKPLVTTVKGTAFRPARQAFSDAAIGFVFYTAEQFPPAYRGDAFVAMRGSWNRKPPTGYKVVRIRFENGEPVGFEDFLTGFLIDDGRAHFARIAGLAVARDGALLVSDDTNGVIYRVSYRGNQP
jgi:glucose/arabinose dehydrogenase